MKHSVRESSQSSQKQVEGSGSPTAEARGSSSGQVSAVRVVSPTLTADCFFCEGSTLEGV